MICWVKEEGLEFLLERTAGWGRRRGVRGIIYGYRCFKMDGLVFDCTYP